MMDQTDSNELLGSLPHTDNELGPTLTGEPTITLQYEGQKQADFDKKYGRLPKKKLTARSVARGLRQRCQCSKSCVISTLQDKVPVIDLVRTYRFKEYILGDVIAGISTAVMQVPQGMGYALLASLPPIVGLYTSFFPVLVYFIFGRSRYVSMGTMALSSLVIASAIGKGLPGFLTNAETQSFTNLTATNSSDNSTHFLTNSLGGMSEVDHEKIRIATTVSLIAGVSLLVMSIFRLGIVASYMSEPFIAGYMCAATIQVVTHQVKHLLGITVGIYSGPLSYFYLLGDIFINIKKTNIATLIVSVLCLSILILVKKLVNDKYANKLKVPVPVDIIVVILATVISHFCTFEDRFGVKIIKEIPQGLPNPSVPSINQFGMFIMDGVTLGIINFILLFMMVKMFSEKHNDHQDANQEMFATGICAIFGAFFSSMAASTSPPRCILSEQTGGRTQLTQLISAFFVLLVLLFLAPLLEPLPVCVLASLILASCIPLFRYFKACIEYWHTSKFDFATWTFTAVTTMLTGVDIGILTGIGFTLLMVVIRSQYPHITKVRMTSPDNILLDNKYTEQSLLTLPGIDIVRFQSAIYFATLDIFKDELYSLTVKPADLIQAKKCKEKELKVSYNNIQEKSHNATNLQTDGMYAETSCDLPLTEPNGQHTLEQHMTQETPGQIQAVLLDCSGVSFLDTEGAKLLSQLYRDYSTVGIRLALCNLTEKCRDTLSNVRQCQDLTSSALYPSVFDAVLDIKQSGQD